MRFGGVTGLKQDVTRLGTGHVTVWGLVTVRSLLQNGLDRVINELFTEWGVYPYKVISF